jgi:hypothetical protein
MLFKTLVSCDSLPSDILPESVKKNTEYVDGAIQWAKVYISGCILIEICVSIYVYEYIFY